jgi:ribonuclease P/MRP protein subunit POP8
MPSKAHDLDALTVSTLLLQPLTAYLGTMGSAIPIDILHTQGRSAYVRIPRQDARAFQAGLSGWIGSCDAGSVPGVEEGGRVRVAWRVVVEGGSLGLLRGGGEELFAGNGVAY